MNVRAELLVVLLTIALAVPLAGQNGGPSRTGRRTASIAGRIIDSNGAAAANARIAVYAVREGAAAAIVATGTSGYDGRYEITGLAPDIYMVGVTPRNGAGFGGEVRRGPTPPVETLYPGVVDRDRAQPITVFEGVPAEGIDVWLAPAPQRFSISGRVFWPEGAEPRNLVIEYGGPDTVRRGIWYVDDPGGLFTIEGVGPETYVLLARAETTAGPLLGLVSTTVSVEAAHDVRVMLRQPGGIEGRILVEGNMKLPLTGLRVSPVQTLLTLSPLYPAGEATVDADGRFSLPHLLGEYTLDVTGLPSGWRVRRVIRDGTPLPTGRIPVAAGEHVTALEIVVGGGST